MKVSIKHVQHGINSPVLFADTHAKSLHHIASSHCMAPQQGNDLSTQFTLHGEPGEFSKLDSDSNEEAKALTTVTLDIARQTMIKHPSNVYCDSSMASRTRLASSVAHSC